MHSVKKEQKIMFPHLVKSSFKKKKKADLFSHLLLHLPKSIQTII